jgi:magnesium chelatase family protein
MNPCPCGYAGDPSGRCRCSPDAITRYGARISGPLLDRIDLHVDVPRLAQSALHGGASPGEASLAVRARVAAARARQLERARRANAWLAGRQLERDCALGARDAALLERACEQLGLSARAYHRILRVARTIADLAGADAIETTHLSEAISYRSFDRGQLERGRVVNL